MIMNLIPGPSPLLRGWGMELKVVASKRGVSLMTSPHPEALQEPMQSCLLEKETHGDTPVLARRKRQVCGGSIPGTGPKKKW